MKKLTLTIIFAFLTTMLAPPATRVAVAQGQAQASPSLAIPVSAENFTGTFNLTRFANIGGAVKATGTLTGILTTPNGPVSVARNIALPVNVLQGAPTAAAVPGPAPAQVTAVCDILHLELGPLDLDLLGLVVHLNRIVLDIDAESGPGNLLGNLLCAVVGLLDNPGGLSQVLNQILGIIGA